MTTKVVTDSCSDITQQEANKLRIIVIPAYVRFGEEVYRDGVDIDSDEFYHKMVTSPVHPSTAAPSPGDFTKAYQQAAQEANEIVSIHVTKKHSAVYDAALVAKELAQNEGCRIEVIDSRGVTIWQGLVAIAAARAAQAGCSLQQVLTEVHETIGQLRALALLDTLEYAVKGGRLSSTLLSIESRVNVKPLIHLRNGEIRPAGLARTRSKGIGRLHQFARSAVDTNDLAIAHSTTPDDAQALAEYVSSLFPNVVPRIARLGPALGAHAGPGALVVAFRKTG